MRHRKLRLWGLIAVLIAASLALSSCGMAERMLGTSSDADSTGDAGSADPPVEATAVPAIDPAVAALLPSAPAPASVSMIAW